MISETTIVNINTVLLAARNFESEGSTIIFDGWTARVDMPDWADVIEEIVILRKATRMALQKALFNNLQFSVASFSTLVPLLDFLKKDLRVREIRGTRIKKPTMRDLASIHLSGLPMDVTQFQLRRLLAARQIENIQIPIGQKTGVGRGFAFVTLESREAAKECVQFFEDDPEKCRIRGHDVRVRLVEEADPVTAEQEKAHAESILRDAARAREGAADRSDGGSGELSSGSGSFGERGAMVGKGSKGKETSKGFGGVGESSGIKGGGRSFEGRFDDRRVELRARTSSREGEQRGRGQHRGNVVYGSFNSTARNEGELGAAGSSHGRDGGGRKGRQDSRGAGRRDRSRDRYDRRR